MGGAEGLCLSLCVNRPLNKALMLSTLSPISQTSSVSLVPERGLFAILSSVQHRFRPLTEAPL